MTTEALKRPHFHRPPIFEQAITLGFERLAQLEIVDHGLFWATLRDQFPDSETGPRITTPVEIFDGTETQILMSAAPSLQLPRAIFRNDTKGEIVQVQDDTFVFNWIANGLNNEYPRFERTSARLWELFGKFSEFYQQRHGVLPQLRHCEITNVNVIPVADFGESYDDMSKAFVVDPFEWEVPGLEAETYVRRRLHRILDERGRSVGRLHSVISPTRDQSDQDAFQFELTARSVPNIHNRIAAEDFFARAHSMINGAFLASVQPAMREVWREYDG